MKINVVLRMYFTSRDMNGAPIWNYTALLPDFPTGGTWVVAIGDTPLQYQFNMAHYGQTQPFETCDTWAESELQLCALRGLLNALRHNAISHNREEICEAEFVFHGEWPAKEKTDERKL